MDLEQTVRTFVFGAESAAPVFELRRFWFPVRAFETLRNVALNQYCCKIYSVEAKEPQCT